MTTRTLRMRKRTLARKLKEHAKALKDGVHLRWLHTRDMPGTGTKTRLACEKAVADELHLMSEAEHAAFLEAWWRSDVVGIYDQVALDRNKARRAAAALNIDYPTYWPTGEPAVLSTDLVLVTESANKYGREAWSVKALRPGKEAQLTPSQKIERRTWEDEGVTCRLVMSHGMHANRSKNLAWIFRAANEMVGRSLSADEMSAQTAMHRLIRRHPPMSVQDACLRVDREFHLPAGSGARAFRQLAGTKRIRFDLDVRDPLRIFLNDVWCCPALKARRVVVNQS